MEETKEEKKNPIKEFFEKGVVKIVEATVIGVASIGLIIGGVETGKIAEIPNLSLIVATAIEAAITYIQGFKALKK